MKMKTLNTLRSIHLVVFSIVALVMIDSKMSAGGTGPHLNDKSGEKGGTVRYAISKENHHDMSPAPALDIPQLAMNDARGSSVHLSSAVNPSYKPISSVEDFTPSVRAVVVITPFSAFMYFAFIVITAFIISAISWELMKRARRRHSLERRDFITL